MPPPKQHAFKNVNGDTVCDETGCGLPYNDPIHVGFSFGSVTATTLLTFVFCKGCGVLVAGNYKDAHYLVCGSIAKPAH